jgi:hypothetical protein
MRRHLTRSRMEGSMMHRSSASTIRKIRANNSTALTDSTKSVEGSDLNNHERIASRAYTLYEQRGRQDGYDLDDWLEAERQVLG